MKEVQGSVMDQMSDSFYLTMKNTNRNDSFQLEIQFYEDSELQVSYICIRQYVMFMLKL